ncbi:MAG: hypothetical protein K9L74_01285 [Candidatus Izimaplasma sp.]|nr:hypothetical protein [Candidatus Izimaplasma bacterium]
MSIKKKLLLVSTLLLTLFGATFVTDNSYAYWASSISSTQQTTTGTVTVSSWNFIPIWDSTTTYYSGDVVEYNGSYYEAKKTNTNEEPEIAKGWRSNWTQTTVN